MNAASNQYDIAPLREGAFQDYARVLDELSIRWLSWAEALREASIEEPGPPSPEVEILFSGLKLALYSAAYQTLPTKRAPSKAVNDGTMQTKFANGDSRKELWDLVSRKLRRKTNMTPLQNHVDAQALPHTTNSHLT